MSTNNTPRRARQHTRNVKIQIRNFSLPHGVSSRKGDKRRVNAKTRKGMENAIVRHDNKNRVEARRTVASLLRFNKQLPGNKRCCNVNLGFCGDVFRLLHEGCVKVNIANKSIIVKSTKTI